MDLAHLILACAPLVSPDSMTTYIEQRSQADPLAIHIAETDRWIRPQTKDEAIAAAKKLAEGGAQIEAGLGQIKNGDWKTYGLTAETVFDPCRNLAAAEQMLVASYEKPKTKVSNSRRAGRRKITKLVKEIAPRYDLDSKLVLAVIEAESNFNPKARSPKRAQGLMQLIPATARRFGVKDPWDPEENLHGGMAYLRWLLDRFDGDIKLALAGYNAGEKAVERHGGIPPYPETQAYVRRIAKRLGATDQQRATAKQATGKGGAEQEPKKANLFFEVVADGFSQGERLAF